MTATTTKTTPTQRRSDWMRDVMAPINAHHLAGTRPQLTDYARTLRRIRTEGAALGRSVAWRGAVAWFDLVLAETPRPTLHWTVLQGSVWLNYANN